MSATLDRFKRVLSAGMAVSDQLVTKRQTKVNQGLAAVQAQMARLTQAGLQPSPEFLTQFQTLQQQLTTAMQQPSNQAKCDALEPLKNAFRTIAQQSTQRVDAILADAALMRQNAAAAQSAINNAERAIQQITNPAFSAPFATGLVTVRNNCPDIAAATSWPQVKAAMQKLTTRTADANAIATNVGATVKLLALHAVKLAEVDTALSALSAVTAKITEPPQKNAADIALAALTQRRDALANAGPATLAQQMRGSTPLLKDIATGTATGNLNVTWGDSKTRRDVIRKDADEYEAAGKRENLPALEAGGAELKDDLTKLESLSFANPQAAINQLPKLEADHNKLKKQFKDTVAQSQLLQKVKDLVTANPDCAEAQMQKALGTDKMGGDVFKQRLLKVYNIARFQGSPEINLLTPGEAVAIHTYTTNDYKQMNGYLFGKTPLDPPDPKTDPHQVMPTEDQIKIKNKQAVDALAKLPVWTGGMTKRGDRGFTGDDVMFAFNNEFTIKAFWSTDKTTAFVGKWQISVFGKTGRNIAMMSKYPTEDEVLFAPGTKFKVVDFDDTIPTSIAIVVEEVI